MVKKLQKQMGTVLCFFLLFSTAHAEFTHKKNPARVDYYFQIANFPSADLNQSQCAISITVPYDELIFVRVDSGFQASYSFSIYLFDQKKKDILFKKQWDRTVFVRTFEETNLQSNLDSFQTEILRSPGKYRLVFMVEDAHVKKPFYKEIPITIKDFKTLPLGISSIILQDSLLHTEEKGVSFQPNVSNIFARNFYAVFEVIKNVPGSRIILFQIRNRENKKIFQRDTLRVSGEKRLFRFAPLVRVDSLKSGSYWVEALVPGERKKRTERTAFEVWKAMEFDSEGELDTAIETLVYIAPPDVFSRMKQAKSFSEKKKLFERFWKGVDPTPGTEMNELQREYYRRVTYANRHFEVLSQQGWRSDRGRIYILYGPPDSVEHQVDNQSRDYEIWRYNQLKRKFVFFDQSGNGNYRLIEKR
ncbi:MAG: GWxTD domain-containing protein [Calditrichaeota bacterium]|nr:GWxTD domain-containing protein [Calditrichota bacterium]